MAATSMTVAGKAILLGDVVIQREQKGESPSLTTTHPVKLGGAKP